MKLVLGIIIMLSTNCLAQNNNSVSHDSIYELTSVQEQPSFPGGDKEMYLFFVKNIAYPQFEKEYEIEGKVFVSFVVDSIGNIGDLKIYQSVVGGIGCDKEALRVIKLMPKWKPGKVNNIAVSVRITQPISFKLGGMMNPNNSEQYNEGLKKEKLGDYSGALIHFESAISNSKNPKDYSPLFHKAICLLKLKDSTNACATFQKIKNAGTNIADEVIKKYCIN